MKYIIKKVDKKTVSIEAINNDSIVGFQTVLTGKKGLIRKELYETNNYKMFIGKDVVTCNGYGHQDNEIRSLINGVMNNYDFYLFENTNELFRWLAEE